MTWWCLLTDAEALDQVRVAVRVLALQVVEKSAALADQLQQAAARVMVLRVRLEMVGQIADALAEERNLHFRGSGVALMGSVAADDFGLAVLAQHDGRPSTNGPETSERDVPHRTAVSRIYKR